MSLNLGAIFDLETRGLIELPAEIGRLRTSLDRLNAVEIPTSRHPLDVADDLTLLTVEAAHADALAEVDYRAPMRAAEEAEHAQHRATAILAAREAVANQLQSAVHSNSTVIVKLLQPRFNRFITELREALVLAAQWPDPVAVLSAPAKVRTGLAGVHTARHALDAIFAARGVLSRLGYRSGTDTENEFAMIANLNELWPRTARQLHPAPPWGQDDQLTWSLQNDAQVWLPTLAEQDERYDEAYGELIKSQTRTVAGMRALASQIGGGDRIAGPSNVRQQPTTEAGPTPTQVVHQRLFGTTPVEPVPAA